MCPNNLHADGTLLAPVLYGANFNDTLGIWEYWAEQSLGMATEYNTPADQKYFYSNRHVLALLVLPWSDF